MPFPFRSFNITMDHAQPGCQRSLLWEVTCGALCSHSHLERSPWKMGGEAAGTAWNLMPEPHALVQPQEVIGTSGNSVRQGQEARARMWHSGGADRVQKAQHSLEMADTEARSCKRPMRFPWGQDKNRCGGFYSEELKKAEKDL